MDFPRMTDPLPTPRDYFDYLHSNLVKGNDKTKSFLVLIPKDQADALMKNHPTIEPNEKADLAAELEAERRKIKKSHRDQYNNAIAESREKLKDADMEKIWESPEICAQIVSSAASVAQAIGRSLPRVPASTPVPPVTQGSSGVTPASTEAPSAQPAKSTEVSPSGSTNPPSGKPGGDDDKAKSSGEKGSSSSGGGDDDSNKNNKNDNYVIVNDGEDDDDEEEAEDVDYPALPPNFKDSLKEEYKNRVQVAMTHDTPEAIDMALKLVAKDFGLEYDEDSNCMVWIDDDKFYEAEEAYVAAHGKISELYKARLERGKQARTVKDDRVDAALARYQKLNQMVLAHDNPPEDEYIEIEYMFLNEDNTLKEGPVTLLVKKRDYSQCSYEGFEEYSMKAQGDSPALPSKYKLKAPQKANFVIEYIMLDAWRKGKDDKPSGDPLKIIVPVVKRLASFEREAEEFHPSMLVDITIEKRKKDFYSLPLPAKIVLIDSKYKIKKLPLSKEGIDSFMVDNDLEGDSKMDIAFAAIVVNLLNIGAIESNSDEELSTPSDEKMKRFRTNAATAKAWEKASKLIVVAALHAYCQGMTGDVIRWYESFENVYGRFLSDARMINLMKMIHGGEGMRDICRVITLKDMETENNVLKYRLIRLSSPYLVVNAFRMVYNTVLRNFLDIAALKDYVAFLDAGLAAQIASGPLKIFCEGRINPLKVKNIPGEVTIAQLAPINDAPFHPTAIRQAYEIMHVYGIKIDEWFQAKKVINQKGPDDATFALLVSAVHAAGENKTKAMAAKAIANSMSSMSKRNTDSELEELSSLMARKYNF